MLSPVYSPTLVRERRSLRETKTTQNLETYIKDFFQSFIDERVKPGFFWIFLKIKGKQKLCQNIFFFSERGSSLRTKDKLMITPYFLSVYLSVCLSLCLCLSLCVSLSLSGRVTAVLFAYQGDHDSKT